MIQTLPQEVLAIIFSYMDVKDIMLSVRLVCRWWRDTVALSEVWKRRTVSDCVEDRRTARIAALALTVAPRIGMLQVLQWSPNADLDLTNIDCGAVHLHLALHEGIDYQKQVFTKLKNKHLLQKIRLDIDCSEIESQWFLASSLSLNLASLTVDSTLRQCSDGFVEALLKNTSTNHLSLKSLHYEGSLADGVVDVVLKARGHSLTSVSIVDTKDVGLVYPVMSLIISCTNLYEVVIPPTLRLDELLKCVHLKKLTLLNIFIPNNPAYHEWKATLLRFCRLASWLLHLRLRACTNDPRSFDIIFDVVRAFSSSGVSELQSFSLDEELQEPFNTRLCEHLQTLPKKPQLTYEDWMGGGYVLPPLLSKREI